MFEITLPLDLFLHGNPFLILHASHLQSEQISLKVFHEEWSFCMSVELEPRARIWSMEQNRPPTLGATG